MSAYLSAIHSMSLCAAYFPAALIWSAVKLREAERFPMGGKVGQMLRIELTHGFRQAKLWSMRNVSILAFMS